jgi:hypothetical protein
MNGQRLSCGFVKRLTVGLCAAAFIIAAASAQAFTVVQFAPIRAALSNEIATLSAIENPTTQELKRLRALMHASGVLTNTATDDGKTLRSLMRLLPAKAYPDYAPLFEVAGTNLVHSYNKNFQFTSNLVHELPPSDDAVLAQKQLNRMTNLVLKLNASSLPKKIAAKIDPARRQLNGLLDIIARGLIPVFPGDLSPNTIAARVNGINMRVSRDHATDNLFSVIETETNLVIFCSAVDGTVNDLTGGRGLVLAISNVVTGTFRYPIPDQATALYRTGVYSGNETISNMTSGAVFVSTQGGEIFGVFSASGNGVTIAEGRFRLDLPTNSAFAIPPAP